MRQFSQYKGHHALRVSKSPDGLDIVASRSWNQVFLFLINTIRTQSKHVRIQVDGLQFLGGSGSQIIEDPTTEISSVNSDEILQTKSILLQKTPKINLPPASVTSLALTMA